MLFDSRKLRAARKARGIRQCDLAEASGHTRLTVINAESGRVTPKVSTLCDFASALGVDLRDFFSKDDR